MKKWGLFLLFSCFCLLLCAQRIEPFKGKNGKYGLFNRVEREIIVKPKYDSCDCSWESDFCKVKIKNKWGFVNKNGKEITPVKYDLCYGFSYGFATVMLNDKWGYVDTNGKEKMLSANYDCIGNCVKYVSISEWSDGDSEYSNIFIGNLIVIRLNRQSGLIDTNENIIVPCKYDAIQNFYGNSDFTTVRIGEKYGMINNKGEEIIPVIYDEVQTIYHNNDFITVRIGEKFGMINNKGEEIIPIIYDEIDTDDKDFVIVQLNDKQGVIDYNGKEVVSLKWDECIPYENGISIVELNDKQGVIENYTGKEIIPIKYDIMRFLRNINHFLVKINGKYGLIDITEKEIIPFMYSNIRYIKYDHLWAVEFDDKWGVIDTNGREILPIKYDFINPYQGFYCIDETENHRVVGYIVIELDGKRGIIDTSGKIILPIKYDGCFSLTEDLTVVRLNGKESLIRNFTEEVIVSECDNGIYHLSNNALRIYCNCTGKIIFVDNITGEKIAVVAYNDYWNLSDNYIAIKIGRKWGVINNMGEKIIPYKYKLSEVQDKLREILEKKKP